MIFEVTDPRPDVAGVVSVQITMKPTLEEAMTQPRPMISQKQSDLRMEMYLRWDDAQELHDQLGKFLANG